MNKFCIDDQVKNIFDENKSGSIKCIIEKSSNNSTKYSYLIFDKNSNKYFIESEIFIKLIKRISPEDESRSSKMVREIAESSGYKSDIKVGDVVTLRSRLPIGQYVISSIIEMGYGEELHHYELIPINNGSLSTDESCVCGRLLLEFQYHDTQWEKYITESVGNGLPAWRGELYNFFTVIAENYEDDYRNDTIPTEYMRHILDNHSIYERVGDIVKDHKTDIMDALGIETDANLKKIRDSLKSKLLSRDLADKDIHHPGRLVNKTDIRFTEKEQLLADIICNTDRKDIYRLDMTCLQIMHAIKEAYETAEKVSNTKGQIETDRRTGKSHAPIKGQRVYRGKSKTYNLLIEFWFDLDLRVITTAYPVEGGV